MKTYISNIIPKLQNYSQKLDNLTLLMNQHWVVIDEIPNSKNVYIFRSNSELLISQNGKVQKGKWEYLGNNSLLIDKEDDSFLFKHGFFDENILALKIDSKNEYVFLINETKYEGELNSINKVIDFLTKKYIEPKLKENIQNSTRIKIITETNKTNRLVSYKSDKGIIEIPPCVSFKGQRAFKNGVIAENGKYKLSFLSHIHVENGIIIKETLF